MNIFQKIICFMGGANLQILQDCPTDKNKFIATGIGVLNSALLSVCTMGFAMYMATAGNINTLLLVAFSILWGFIIFGIDWGLVSTIHKRKSYSLGSGVSLVLGTLFRLIVSVALSFTVSKPLEVLVFRDYIPVVRREMQVNYETRLNNPFREAEEEAIGNLINATDRILALTYERRQVYQNDPALNQLRGEKYRLQERYRSLSAQHETANRTSRTNINSANNAIGDINSRLNEIRASLFELSTTQQQQISILENSRQSHNAIINRENEAIRARNATLRELRLEIATNDNEIRDRYSAIGAVFDDNRRALYEDRKRFVAISDTISERANIEFARNRVVARVFDKDNLINSIMAINYLKQWRNDPYVDIAQKRVGRASSLVGLLLVIVIMLVDTAPVVIKLLVKRGCYEEEKEKRERKNEFKCQADSIAYERTYQTYASTVNQYETKINEIRAFEKAKDDFNTIVNKMREKSIDDIDKMIKGFQKIDNQKTRKVLESFQDKLTEQLDKTKDKMFELYDTFINNIK